MAESRSPKLGDPLGTGVVAGERLGNYEILKRLAAGGMAEIFLARIRKMTGFQKMVVIKRILPQLAQNTEFVEMFLDEARIAATLEHPNIVQTYDVGVLDENFYIAMEYLHGEDVRSVMRALRHRNIKLPIEMALHIVISACAGLHYAHEKVGFDGHPLEIVHRDVSPQNIIVTYEGGVKLLDFGIAKASNRLRETRVGTLKGKVPYMSPEQCRSEPLDRRSDIFSLGILLYELSLSKRLYPGTSDFEVLKEIVEGTVTPPVELDPGYPPALNAIVMRALEKQKEHRWQTAREMQAELEKLVRQEHLGCTPMAVQEFLEELFGHKIEAWREAQAQGKTLDEHLLTITHDSNGSHSSDNTEDVELDSPEAVRARAEREAFLAQLVPRRSAPPAPSRRGWVIGLTALLLIGGFGVVEYWPRLTGRAPAGRSGTGGNSTTALPPREIAGPPQELPARATDTPTATVTVKTSAPVAMAPTGTAAPTAPGVAPTPAGTTSAPAAAAGGEPLAAPGDNDNLETETPPLGVTHGSHHGHHATAAAPKPTARAKAGAPAPLATHATGAAMGGAGAAPVATPRPAVNAPGVASAPVVPPPAPAKLEGEGTLVLATSPWCRVIVDGTDRGSTPLKIKLQAGPHSVLLSNPEFKINRELPIMIRPNEETRKKLDFAD